MGNRARNCRAGARAAPALLCLAVCAATAGPVRAQEILWSDEFDSGSVPDPAAWSFDLGDWGWGNRELQDYTSSSDNVRVEDGNLVFTARAVFDDEAAPRFTSGRLNTRDKLTFRYGTVEARIRVPDLADGLWPAFWTLGNNHAEVGWPRCGELDIMEMGHSDAIAAGSVNRRVGSAAHWDNAGARATYGDHRDQAQDLDGEFHVFSMDWTPERVTTYVDGKQVWSFSIGPDRCVDCSEFHQPHFLILNLAVGGNYTGLFSADQVTAPLPAEMLVDYVRILDNGHTELGGSAAPANQAGGTSAAVDQ